MRKTKPAPEAKRSIRKGGAEVRGEGEEEGEVSEGNGDSADSTITLHSRGANKQVSIAYEKRTKGMDSGRKRRPRSTR